MPDTTNETPAAAADEPASPDTPAPLNDTVDFFTEANRIRKNAGYDGKLTGKLLRELQPLLKAPIPPKYIDRIPPTKGKPYESTGVRSVQVQVDRMNEVLGLEHWRWLPHYAEEGTVCRIVVIVGNDLAGVRLDDRGNLDADSLEGAEILVVRDGWGGHNRGSGKGDVLKGAETNTLKRVLARVGPGCDIYRLDYDLDAHNSDPVYQPAAGAQTGIGGDPLSPKQVHLIRARAKDAGLTDTQLCNICLRAAGQPLMSESQAADAMNNGFLERMPKTLVDGVLAGIQQGPPPAPEPWGPTDVPVTAMAPVAHLTTAAHLVPAAADTTFPPADVTPPAHAPSVGQAAPGQPQPGAPQPPAGTPAPPLPSIQPTGAAAPPAPGQQPQQAPGQQLEPAAGELGPVDRDSALAHLSFANAAPGSGPAAVQPAGADEQQAA